jgi:outer membrane lipoprotein LolB
VLALPIFAPPAASAANEQSFVLEGRFSVRDGSQSNTGKLSWQHATASDLVSFASPLGNQVARLERHGTRYTLIDAQQRVTEAASAEALTAQTVGVPLPLDSLAKWVVRRPASMPQFRLSSAGNAHEEGISEAGWSLRLDYEAPRDTPVRLIARREAPPLLEVRLVVDRLIEGGR